MGILGLAGFLLFLGGLAIMSKTSRVVLILLLGASIYYWQSISAVFHGGSGPEMHELKMAFTLLSANIGCFIIACILGILKNNSINEIQYRAKKMKFFTFLAKWGLIYGAYAYTVGKLIDWVVGEDGIGWFFMRAWGSYGFVALLVLWWIFKPRKAVQKI